MCRRASTWCRSSPGRARSCSSSAVPYRVSRLADLPPEADADRGALVGMQARSALLLPVETGERLRHLIALQTVHEEREWPDVFVTRLRVLGADARRCPRTTGDGRRAARGRGAPEPGGRLRRGGPLDPGLRDGDLLGHGTGTCDLRVLAGRDHRPGAFPGVGPSRRLAVVREAIERSAHAGEPIDVEYRIIRPGDGRVRWICLPWAADVSRSPGAARTPDGRLHRHHRAEDVPKRRFARARLAWPRPPTSPASRSSRWTGPHGHVRRRPVSRTLWDPRSGAGAPDPGNSGRSTCTPTTPRGCSRSARRRSTANRGNSTSSTATGILRAARSGSARSAVPPPATPPGTRGQDVTVSSATSRSADAPRRRCGGRSRKSNS